MDLTLLAPDIQRKVLELPRTVNGRDPVRERLLRPIAAEADWSRQREMWQCFITNAPRQQLQH